MLGLLGMTYDINTRLWSDVQFQIESSSCVVGFVLALLIILPIRSLLSYFVSMAMKRPTKVSVCRSLYLQRSALCLARGLK